jgi:hypothetical protein
MEKELKDIQEYQQKFVYPGLIMSLVGLVLFIIAQGSVWMVAGVLLFFIGIALVVHARGAIKDIRYKMKESFINEQANLIYQDARFTYGGFDVVNELEASLLPIGGSEAKATNVVYGTYHGMKFNFHDLDVITKKYIRGDESGGSRTETKVIFSGLMFVVESKEETKDYIVISAKKRKKKRYSFDGSSKYFNKHFTVESSSEDFTKDFINPLFLESFFNAIDKYGKLSFSFVDGRYYFLIEHPKLFNFLKVEDKMKTQFDYDISLPKELIKHFIK